MDLVPLANGVGVVAVVLAMGWLVVTGRLVPRRTYEDALKANERKDEQIAEKDLQLRHMAEIGRLMGAIMRAVQRKADVVPGEGSDEEPVP